MLIKQMKKFIELKNWRRESASNITKYRGSNDAIRIILSPSLISTTALLGEGSVHIMAKQLQAYIKTLARNPKGKKQNKTMPFSPNMYVIHPLHLKGPY